MKDFRTELIPTVSAFPVSIKDRFFTIGSCFADSIGNHLAENKFQTWNNFFGTVYNPLSIHELLLFGLEKSIPPQESYVENKGAHFNYYFHSTFFDEQQAELENKIQNSLEEANEFLKTTDRVIITYGTAFVYRLKSNDQVVANCHKMPSENFTKVFLAQDEIVKSFQNFYSKLKAINPKCKIILTVSPVRHLKDTFELNAVSKSILRVACHSITNQFHDVEYFPAHEILLDDLRDYRFYKIDRLHPTDEAVEYIWEKFVGSYVDQPTKKIIYDWQEIKKGLDHKSFDPSSEHHIKFLKTILSKLEKLNSDVDVSVEIREVKSKISFP